MPPALSGVAIGSVVRVPLGGRRVRGHVVAVQQAAATERTLRDVVSVSGDLPIFNKRLLETVRWAAIHYVAPLAALLPRSGPPNLARAIHLGPFASAIPALASPLPEVSAAAAEGRHLRPQALIGSGPWHEAVGGTVAPVIAAGRSAMIVLPTQREAEQMTAALRAGFGHRVHLASSALPAAQVTATWVRAATAPGLILCGTREVALWPVADLGIAVVIEEGRRGMKARATPTLHVRDILRRRANVERFQLVFAGPVPTVETFGFGTHVHEPPARAWRLIEVVDRRDEPPGSGVLTERVRVAVRTTVRDAGTAFVMVHRRGYAPALRCARCGRLRQCPNCDAMADRTDECRRCQASLGSCVRCSGRRFQPLGAGVGRVTDELRRVVDGMVGHVGDAGAAVRVGTERDIPAVGDVDLAIVVDADAWLMAPHYRAGEDALRVLARVAGTVRRGGGRRAMIQTSAPGHDVLAALRSGHPSRFLRQTMSLRAESGFPPAGELMTVVVAGGDAASDSELRATTDNDGEVIGPAHSGDRMRWLVQGRDLRPTKVRLRQLVQKWRDAGVKVRVDADPIDL